MVNLAGPGIFWTTLVSTASLLMLATLIGRPLGRLFPARLRGPARFYLSPVLGLATLTILASIAGRILPLGNSVIVPVTIICLLLWSLAREPRVVSALRHAAAVGVFGLACGASILGPLYVFGAFNAHNDAFTYLVHANWLQEHAFGDVISAKNVSPLTTQIFLYQQYGFRMGGSFLLALAQSLLNLRWSYEAYPAVIISAIAVCCLNIGFPIASVLRSFRRAIRYALLALPAFTLGGLVFGASLGFLPQTIGLALGGGLLFVVGPLLRWVAIDERPASTIAMAAIPVALLCAAAIFAYSELAPFLLVAILVTGLFIAFRFRAWARALSYIAVLSLLAVLVLNIELIRAFYALRSQSGAVVGSPVDWTLLGYLAHALGVHGGASDAFQWSSPDKVGLASHAVGATLTLFLVATLLLGRRAIWRITSSGALMPSAVVLAIFLTGLIYFRYLVPSPFTKGLGQSWNQFKLSDWAHPFVMAFVLLSVAHLCKGMGKRVEFLVGSLFAIGLLGATLVGVARTAPLIQFYAGTRDLNSLYQDFRQKVLADCPPGVPIYLALNGERHKLRQMAAYYLPDRELTSAWLDDVYFAQIPSSLQRQELKSGDCVVEPLAQGALLSDGAAIGPFRIGRFDGQGRVRVASPTGAFDRESEGQNWWHWVARKVIFKLEPLLISKEVAQTRLRFEYATRGKQALTLRLSGRDGSNQVIVLESQGDTPLVFDNLVDLPPSELVEFSVETDGKATRLGESDSRMAAWVLRNLTIAPGIQQK